MYCQVQKIACRFKELARVRHACEKCGLSGQHPFLKFNSADMRLSGRSLSELLNNGHEPVLPVGNKPLIDVFRKDKPKEIPYAQRGCGSNIVCVDMVKEPLIN